MKKVISRVFSMVLVVLMSVGIFGDGFWIEASFIQDISGADADIKTLGIETSDIQERQRITAENGKVQTELTYSNGTHVTIEAQEVIAVSNFKEISRGKTVVNCASDAQEMINALTKVSKMDESYELVESYAFDNDYWFFTWIKRYDNGILNPYEGVDAVVNRYTKELVVYRKFNETPNTTTPVLTVQEARDKIDVWESQLNKNVVEISLEYIKSNYDASTNKTVKMYGDVRLAYMFDFVNNGYKIYVDAITGEAIHFSQNRATAWSISAPECAAFPEPDTQTASANACFQVLGYSPTYVRFGMTDLSTIITTALNQTSSRGFYLACHSDEQQTVLFDYLYDADGQSYVNAWSITLDELEDINSGSHPWNFVFIDACYSGIGTAWANAFGITNASTDKAFLGWFDSVEGPYSVLFTSAFFPQVIAQDHSNNIRDAAVWAACQVPGDGTTPIRFYGDLTYNGRLQ